MASTDRTLIVRGPAIISYSPTAALVSAPVEITTNNDIAVKITRETFDIITSSHGKVDERVKDWKVEISFTPCGEYVDMATVLWPFGSTVLGTSIMGQPAVPATDQTLTIKPLNGRTLLFSNVGLTKMPDLILSTVKTMIGPVTFTALCKNATSRATAASLYTLAGSATSNYAVGFSVAEILTQPWSMIWTGKTGFSETGGFTSKDGIVVSFDMNLVPLETDTDGIIDYMLGTLAVSAKLIPMPGPSATVTEANITDALLLQGSGSVRGGSLNAGGADLVITGATTGAVITLTKAAMKEANMGWGNTSTRNGEVMFVATRTFTAGVAAPLFTFA